MIFYFSGTGNSEWVANELGELLGEEVASIVDIIRTGNDTFRFGADDTVGIVFPVYAGSPPEIVLNFINRISAGGAYTFAVCTCAGGAGNAVNTLSRKMRLDSGFCVIMPNNFIVGADVEAPDIIAAKLKAARESFPGICKTIKDKQSGIGVKASGAAFIMPAVMWGFNHFARSTKKFSVSDGCVGCGLCEKLCSADTIVLENGKPKWGSRCNMCMSCINRCPQRAIQYGEATKNRGRYYFKPDEN